MIFRVNLSLATTISTCRFSAGVFLLYPLTYTPTLFLDLYRKELLNSARNKKHFVFL